MPKKTKRPAAASKARKPARAPLRKQAAGTQGVETVATLRDLRKTTRHTQEDLALAMGVGQGTVSRIEKRDDMLVSTLQHYVESIGGTLQLLVSFPHRPAVRVERLGKKSGRPMDPLASNTAGAASPAHD